MCVCVFAYIYILHKLAFLARGWPQCAATKIIIRVIKPQVLPKHSEDRGLLATLIQEYYLQAGLVVS